MTKTPEEVAKEIIEIAPLTPVNHIGFALIVKAIREAEERGRAASSVDANECGLWCPNCGAHLRAPEVKP